MSSFFICIMAFIAFGCLIEEVERIYKLLAEGAKSSCPWQTRFFAARFGQLRDKFGTSWMILRECAMSPRP